jgi:hypothetical protein
METVIRDLTCALLVLRPEITCSAVVIACAAITRVHRARRAQ